MKEIKLTQNRVALVDDEDFNMLNQFKWCAHKNDRIWYAVRSVPRIGEPGQRTLTMHGLVLNALDGQPVDHKNGDGLDNRRKNLRFCTPSENQWNRHRTWGVSKFKGVSWDKQKNRWRASISPLGRFIHLGYFKTEKEAAIAYDEASLKYHGNFAFTNKMNGMLCQA